MLYYNYSKLGSTCKTQISSLVDNAKYISPSSPIYDKKYTNMMIYPGTNVPEHTQRHIMENKSCSSCK